MCQNPDRLGVRVFCVQEATLLALTDDIDIHEQVTASEAAKHFGITTAAICNWVRRGHLAVTGIDAQGRRTYRKLDLEKVNNATMQRMRKQTR